MNDEINFYIILGILALAMVASIIYLDALLAFADSLLILAFIVIYRLWYVIEASVFRRTNMIEIFNGHEIAGDRSVAIRKLRSKYCATAVAALRGDSSNRLEVDKIENIVENISVPFKFVLQVERLSPNKLMDRLQTSRSMKELELARLNIESKERNIAKSNALKREIEQIEHEIAAVGSGGAPMRLMRYIMTSAIADTRFAAAERARAQIRALASQFGALLNANAQVLDGAELLKVLDIDSVMVL